MKVNWAVVLAVVLAGGCAGKGKVSPPPAIVEPPGGDKREGPAMRPGATAPPVEEAESTLRLPGQGRVYPSEDPRNWPRGAEIAQGGGRAEPRTETKSEPAAHDPLIVPDPEDAFAPPPVPAGEARYRVQLRASSARAAAMALREEMAGVLEIPVFVEHEPGIWKVRAGDFRERVEAEALRRRIVGLGYADAFVVEVLRR